MGLLLLRGMEHAYNTDTGQLHMVRVTGVNESEDLIDLGAVQQPVVGNVSGDLGLELEQDPTSGGLVTVTVPHYRVHQGTMFAASEVSAGANRLYRIVIPEGAEAHVVMHVAGEEAVVVTLHEDTARAGGTPMSLSARNRESVAVPGVTIAHTPGAGADGTLLDTTYDTKKTGESTRGLGEWILAAGKVYLVTVTTGVAKVFGIHFDWYEVTTQE